MRLVMGWPGAITPKVSWETLPIAPMGATEVSPTTRAATVASAKATGWTQAPWSSAHAEQTIWSTMASAAASAKPRELQLPANGRVLYRLPVRMRLEMSPAARPRSLSKLAATITVTPGQRSQLTSGSNQLLSP